MNSERVDRYINPDKIDFRLGGMEHEGDLLVPLSAVRKAIASTPYENVVVHPCALGDEVYFLKVADGGKLAVDQGRVFSICYYADSVVLSVQVATNKIITSFTHFSVIDIGVHVFFTREDAETALRNVGEA